jgi:EAL domain-containing protein (putative c-di-GMP-specific phosphodiesterase class I)
MSLSRVAGDEFCVILEKVRDPESVAAVARRLLDIMHAPFAVAGRELFVTLSVGIALFPQDGRDDAQLLVHADMAMSLAKSTGGNTYAFHSPETNSRSLERLTLETSLRKAIGRHELELHYQPKVDAATGRISGVEALARWTHPQLGPIPPCRFIPLAESTGLIIELGEWLLHRACKTAAQWHRAGLAVPVAVNVSTLQFRQGNLPQLIRGALAETGLPAEALIVELTESLLMEHSEANSELLQAIKGLGVRLSMDDFGTGYSSLGYLKRLPLDELKIDRIFVSDLPADHGSAAIVGAVISMAQGLGLKVTAEGVETQAQLEFLRSNGCDACQGYLFARPMSADAFLTLASRGTAFPVLAAAQEAPRTRGAAQ